MPRSALWFNSFIVLKVKFSVIYGAFTVNVFCSEMTELTLNCVISSISWKLIPSVTVQAQVLSPHQLCGTLCHLRFSRHLRWLCFVNDWRRIYFRNHSLMSYSDDYVSVDLAITFVILDTLNIFLIDWLIDWLSTTSNFWSGCHGKTSVNSLF